MKNVARLIAANVRSRNSSSGTSGWGRFAMRIGKATSEIAPMAQRTHAIGSAHAFCSPRITPKASPPTASVATSEPSQSNRPSRTCRAIPGRGGGRNSATRISGTLTRNEARQPTKSTRTPPAIGPRTVEGGRGRGPDSESAGALLALERVRDDRQRAGHQQGAGRSLEQAGRWSGVRASERARTRPTSPRTG